MCSQQELQENNIEKVRKEMMKWKAFALGVGANKYIQEARVQGERDACEKYAAEIQELKGRISSLQKQCQKR